VPYVYRRPFDYPQHRQAFNLWYLAGAIEATGASAAFTTYAAAISSSTASEQSSRSVRFSSQGVFRRRWPYAVQHSRINLFYTDAVDIAGVATSGAFATYAARVQLGSVGGSTITAVVATETLTTYPAAITGGRRDPLSDDVGAFTTYPATLTRSSGLGESRVGQVPAKGSQNYTPGRLNIKGRSGFKRSGLRELVKRK
jgi:hypothetical protein